MGMANMRRSRRWREGKRDQDDRHSQNARKIQLQIHRSGLPRLAPFDEIYSPLR
jgi:hypothetical protein